MGRNIIRHEDLYKPITKQLSHRKTDAEEFENAYVNHDHPSTMEDGTARVMYIIIMLVGALFVDRWLIWIVASFIYFRFINRRAIQKKQWDKMQSEKKNRGEK